MNDPAQEGVTSIATASNSVQSLPRGITNALSVAGATRASSLPTIGYTGTRKTVNKP